MLMWMLMQMFQDSVLKCEGGEVGLGLRNDFGSRRLEVIGQIFLEKRGLLGIVFQDGEMRGVERWLNIFGGGEVRVEVEKGWGG